MSENEYFCFVFLNVFKFCFELVNGIVVFVVEVFVGCGNGM